MDPFKHVKCASRTDVGKKRANNEDSFGAFPKSGIFCVADGMGGGDDGEIASAAVVKAVEDVATLCVPGDGWGYAAADVVEVLETGLNRASEWIFNRAAEKKQSGCGSTFVGAVLDATHPDNVLAVHAGDSRLYLLHGRSIRQVTRDHSVAEMLGAKDESKITPVFRSMVMNAVGIRQKVEVETTLFKVAAGDRILVCSDGLSRMVPDKKILSISRQNEDVAKAAEALIAAALEAGGVDNVTVVLAEIGELPQPVESRPLPSAASEFVLAGDTDTGDGTGRETDAGTQTLQTAFTSTTATSMVFPEEAEDAADTTADAPPTLSPAAARKRLSKLWWTALVLFVLAAVAAGFLAVKRSMDSSRRATEEFQAAVRAEESRMSAPGKAAAPAASQPAPSPQTVPPAAPQTEVPKAPPPPSPPPPSPPPPPQPAALQPAVAPQAVAPQAVAPQAVPPAAPQSKVPKAAAPAVRAEAFCTNLVKACDGDGAALLVAAITRRMPADRMLDFQEQVRRFKAGVRACARERSAKAAYNLAVDLKFLLMSADAAKEKFGQSEAEKRWLALWAAVVAGNAKDLAAQEACAGMISRAEEVLPR